MLYSEELWTTFQIPEMSESLKTPTQWAKWERKMYDIMKMYMKIEDDIIKDIRFKTFGGRLLLPAAWLRSVKGKPFRKP